MTAELVAAVVLGSLALLLEHARERAADADHEARLRDLEVRVVRLEAREP